MKINRIALGVWFGSCLCAASGTLAQTCTPAWDRTIGSPGVTSDGYVAPMIAMNDGSGQALFAGGSFTSMGGYVARGIAKWNPATHEWGDVGGGCYSNFTNSFLAALHTYDFGSGSELVAAGSYDTAGGVASTTHLARWNGARWTGMPGGQPASAVWALATFQGELVAGGGFASVGGVAANGIARLTGDGWQPLGTGMNGGFSPNVFSLRVHNDGSGAKLYAGGRFASLGGVSGLIARWNGSVWQPVGGGVASGSTFSDIETMTSFNDGSGTALYVGGWDLRPFQGNLCSVAKWDGVRWTAVGQYLGGRTTALAVFDDGSGPALYAGGTAQPGINYVAKLVGNTWVILDGGVGQPSGPPWPSVFGLYTWGDSLYVGGDFDYAGPTDGFASGIVARRGCPPPCDPDFNADGNLDQDDVAYLVAVVAGGPNPNQRDADFNRDGNADQADLWALVHVIAGGNCP